MNKFSEHLLLINDSLNNQTTGKCADRECKFLLHSNPQNNNGLYCCKMCKTSRKHGIHCEKTLFT